MRSNCISVKIIDYLSDNKLHTYGEIAEALEVCKNTVVRHVRDLSTNHEIITYHGGKKKGVMLLTSDRVYLNKEERSKIIVALEKMNDATYDRLIKKFKGDQ